MLALCGNNIKLAKSCGHICEVRIWLGDACFGLDEDDFKSTDAPISVEGEPEYHGDGFFGNRFFFKAITTRQMPIVSGPAARRTARLRMEEHNDGDTLSRVLGPGVQQCILATNGDHGYLPTIARAAAAGGGRSSRARLCSCQPVEVTACQSLTSGDCIQVHAQNSIMPHPSSSTCYYAPHLQQGCAFKGYV